MFIEAFYKIRKIIYLDNDCELAKVVSELEKTGGNISDTDKSIVMIEEIDDSGDCTFIYSEEMHGQPTCTLHSGNLEVWNNMEGFNSKEEEIEDE